MPHTENRKWDFRARQNYAKEKKSEMKVLKNKSTHVQSNKCMIKKETESSEHRDDRLAEQK